MRNPFGENEKTGCFPPKGSPLFPGSVCPEANPFLHGLSLTSQKKSRYRVLGWLEHDHGQPFLNHQPVDHAPIFQENIGKQPAVIVPSLPVMGQPHRCPLNQTAVESLGRTAPDVRPFPSRSPSRVRQCRDTGPFRLTARGPYPHPIPSARPLHRPRT